MAEKYLDATAQWTNIEKAAFLAAHPVGTYWWTSSNTNPNTTYGGTWTQIKDKFVYASGGKSVGNTGGTESVTLTSNQIPSHRHTGPSHSHSLNSHTHTMSHTHSINPAFPGGAAIGVNLSSYSTKIDSGLAGGNLFSSFGTIPKSEVAEPVPSSTGSATGSTGSSGTGNTGYSGGGSESRQYAPVYRRELLAPYGITQSSSPLAMEVI